MDIVYCSAQLHLSEAVLPQYVRSGGIYYVLMQIILVTLFPNYFSSVFATSMLKRAIEKKILTVDSVNIRDFAHDKHHVTDDRPYGGGPGMVLKVEPIDLALQHCREHLIPKGVKPYVVLTSAKGKPFTQQTATAWSAHHCLIIICGHYEGVDERVAQHLVDAEVSVGPFVLTGGEPAAGVIVDAVARLLPGVLGNEASTQGESHGTEGVLGFPQYTRPQEYRGWQVPESLLTGHHAQISSWREQKRPTKPDTK